MLYIYLFFFMYLMFQMLAMHSGIDILCSDHCVLLKISFENSFMESYSHCIKFLDEMFDKDSSLGYRNMC